MVHQNELENCVRGSLVISAFMTTLQKEGDGIDEHTIEFYDEEDETLCVREHIFDHANGRIVGFSSAVVTGSASPWKCNLSLSTNFPLPPEAKNLFFQLNEFEGFTELFIVEGSEIALGPFFNRRSILRTKIAELLLITQEDPPEMVGKVLWRIISSNGGLLALLEIADDIFDQDIKPHMLLVDPFCFYRDGEKFTSEKD